jgi:hypothetical protein
MHPLRRHCRILTGGIVASLALAFGASNSLAQPDATRLTVTTSSVVFDPPTVDDYRKGFVASAQGITFTVATQNGTLRRLATVSIRGTAATVGGGKPVGDVQWRRADRPDWNSLTLLDMDVEGRQMTDVLNNPWSNGILFRVRVTWAADPPATYSADILVTLTQILQ